MMWLKTYVVPAHSILHNIPPRSIGLPIISTEVKAKESLIALQVIKINAHIFPIPCHNCIYFFKRKHFSFQKIYLAVSFLYCIL